MAKGAAFFLYFAFSHILTSWGCLAFTHLQKAHHLFCHMTLAAQILESHPPFWLLYLLGTRPFY